MPYPPITIEGRNCWRRTRSRRAAFLIDGAAYFSALAASFERARESILMLGWDFDSRTLLRPEGRVAGPQDGFAAFLGSLLARNRRLHVHILGWDFAMIYAFERETLPLRKFGLGGDSRLDFRLDNTHPFGGSHHQKIVVVDDAVAFVGGFDITRRRWDTPEHRARDPRRIDPAGRSYPPFHDVQMMVDGDTARELGSLARDRWFHATGSRLRPTASGSDPWPLDCPVHVRDADIAISRTDPPGPEKPGVREVERLFLDSIASARSSIYIETQYMTSSRVAEALARRLGEKNGPEIVMVTPKEPTGLLEETTMGVLRNRLLAALEKRDPYGRLRIYYPVAPDLEKSEYINVHSKVMVVDDSLARVGSANLTNRSMGLDTECDLSLEARGDAACREAIVAFRNGLIAEHLGSSPEKIGQAVEQRGSLLSAIEAMRVGKRTLEVLDGSVSEWLDRLVPEAALIDPERPVEGERLFNRIVSGEEERFGHPLLKAGLLVAGLVALAFLWHYGPLRDWFSLHNVEAFIVSFSDGPAAPFIVVGAFTAAGLLMVPLTLMVMACALAFDPLHAFVYGLSGGLASAAVSYAVGSMLGRDTIRRFAGERVNALTRRITRGGVLAMVAARLVPLLPFTLMNLVAGAFGVRLRDFLLGTAIGLCPGILLISVLERGLKLAILKPGIASLATLFGIAVVAFFSLRYLRRTLETADTDRSKDIRQNKA